MPADHPAARVAAICNETGFRLLRVLSRRTPLENIFISPASLVFALLMVMRGAQGETREEIARALGLQAFDEDEISRLVARLRSTLRVSSPSVQIAMANGLWVNTGIRLSPAFVELIGREYAAQASEAAFADPHIVETINTWAVAATGGRISSLLTAADLSAATDLVLASAVYFKGLWQTPFDAQLTRSKTFTLANGTSKGVPFMSGLRRCLYLTTAAFQALSLPYAGDGLSMEVILPASGNSPDQLVANLDAAQWDQCLAQLEEAQVSIELPRFAIACATEVRDVLSCLGIRRAFGPGADFSPMGLHAGFIGKFKHACEIEISEQGTEAAATTTAVFIRSRPRSVSLDRPFFCAIRDRVTQCLLFAGIVAEPA